MEVKNYKISCIVPIYRNAELVKRCVDSLLSHLGEVSIFQPKLILINDSPDDACVIQLLEFYARKKLPHLQILHNQTNQGFVRTVNQGLEIALAEECDALLVNSDTITYPGTLAEILKVAKSDPQIGFVSPRSNNAAICTFPKPLNGIIPTPEEAFDNWKLASRTLPSFHFAPTAVGFYLHISHAILANIGLLSEEYGVGYEEENDLVMRAGKVGYRAVIANHAFAYHQASASFNLTEINLDDHRLENLKANIEKHPEYIPLVRKYEASAAYRAEVLMSGLLPDKKGRIKIAFDLRGLGIHHNGTNEHAVAMIRSMVRCSSSKFAMTAIGSRSSLAFHGLLEIPGLKTSEPDSPGFHAIAIRIGQPYDVDHLSYSENIAPINVFGILDTISEDCGPLAVSQKCSELWEHTARYSNALFFNSYSSEEAFCNRYPVARALPLFTHLLPTRLSEYVPKEIIVSSREHILILGNHFPHKGVAEACGILAEAFPDRRFILLGGENREQENIITIRSGYLKNYEMEQIFQNAAVVVLPSYMEGFGFGVVKALAAGRPLVAREISATMEILKTYRKYQGVYLFANNSQIVGAMKQALEYVGESSANDAKTKSWDDLADEFSKVITSLLDSQDIYHRAKERIMAGDFLRRALRGDSLMDSGLAQPAMRKASNSTIRSLDINELLKLEGEEFMECAYMTVLKRLADPVGVESYLSQLKKGVHKLDILRCLKESDEGLQCRSEITGLEEALGNHLAHRKEREDVKKPFSLKILSLIRNKKTKYINQNENT